jgi:hypothetical protein
MPDMGPNPHEWVQAFALENGFSRAEKLSVASSFAHETKRALFALYP